MDKLIAYAQIGFSALIFLLFATVLLLVLANPLELGGPQLEILSGLLEQLTIIVALVAMYWFQRQRHPTPIDTPPPAPPSS